MPAATALVVVNVAVVVVPDTGDTGENATVTPVGRFSAATVRSPVRPPVRPSVSVVAVDAPALMVAAVGDNATVTPGAADTVSTTFTVRDVCPVAAPVTVIVYVPAGVADVVVNANELVLSGAGLGVNVAVTPVGNADVVNVTLPAKPPVRASVIVLVAPAPGATVNAAGVAVSVKSGVALEVIVS